MLTRTSAFAKPLPCSRSSHACFLSNRSRYAPEFSCAKPTYPKGIVDLAGWGVVTEKRLTRSTGDCATLRHGEHEAVIERQAARRIFLSIPRRSRSLHPPLCACVATNQPARRPVRVL